jgi:hypothetical protein
MFGEGLTKGAEVHVGQNDLGIAGDAPSFLELLLPRARHGHKGGADEGIHDLSAFLDGESGEMILVREQVEIDGSVAGGDCYRLRVEWLPAWR